MTNISNKCFLRGAINGAGLADSPGIGLQLGDLQLL
jgi:hypothetical protein